MHDKHSNFSEAISNSVDAVSVTDFEFEFQDSYRLKAICALKNVQPVESFNGLNKEATCSNLFSLFLKEIEEKVELINPYLQITMYLINLCKVLLSFKSCDSILKTHEENSSDDEGALNFSQDLFPSNSISSSLSLSRTNSRLHSAETTIDLIPAIKRTLSDRSKTISDAIGESFEANTLHRTLSKWKNARLIISESSNSSKTNFDLFVKLFKSHIDPNSIHVAAMHHQNVAKVRANAFSLLLEFLRCTSGGFCIYPFLGLLYTSLQSFCKNSSNLSVISGVELSSTSFKADLFNLFDSILGFYFNYLPSADGLVHIYASPDIFGFMEESLSLKYSKSEFLKIFVSSFKTLINFIGVSTPISTKTVCFFYFYIHYFRNFLNLL